MPGMLSQGLWGRAVGSSGFEGLSGFRFPVVDP